MDKALEFYHDLLGLNIQGKTNEKDDFISKLLNSKNVELKTIKLAADDNSTRLELLQFINSKSPKTKKITLFEPGFTHISLTVKNLEELYLHLIKFNVNFNCPPLISQDGNLKVAFCRDFEGNYLELTEEI